MTLLFTLLCILVALEHFYFLILEMFLWTSKKGIKTFGLKSKAFAEDTKVLAANQGLYNGFLATGLLYALYLNATPFLMFFLGCIIVAGIYGAFSTKKSILFWFQSVPAILACIAFLLI
ncbi:DUF1304 domain-containing protein [Mangrovimonas sp. CR14]|uniref:DUF1304 domain-containing protein n=1 Tax=Mangrovimonas sp. CR14 TaxID=2706120 RepID=UPI00141DF1EE|nr:DUF1304 domain-containing protein [Mangrovimonas sp. CR14]NIK90520.1 DUF1304 domain-containing protein [Mangrovimonas sp. CR14]